MSTDTTITLTLDALQTLLASQRGTTPASSGNPAASSGNPASPSPTTIRDVYPAIVRTYADGVWIGTVIEETGCRVVLKDCRCLWYWDEAQPRLGLPGVSVRGPHGKDKVTVTIPKHICIDAVGITPISADVHGAWMQHPAYIP